MAFCCFCSFSPFRLRLSAANGRCLIDPIFSPKKKKVVKIPRSAVDPLKMRGSISGRFFLIRLLAICIIGFLESATAENADGTTKMAESEGFKCGQTNEVDLLLALDTSGSIFHSFNRQRQLALELLASLHPSSTLHVGLISFAAEPTLVASLEERVDREALRARLEAVKFTGGNTRIADALELGMEELERFGRENAVKILVLVSDGHGEEDWTRAKAVGLRLQQIPQLHIFAVSASPDFNSFVPTLSASLNKCLAQNGNDSLEIPASNSTSNRLEDAVTAKLIRALLTNESSGEVSGRNGTERRLRDLKSVDASGSHEQQVLEKVENKAEQVFAEDCPTDVLFLIDRFSPSGENNAGLSPLFERQLGLAVQLVERMRAADIDGGNIRLAAVSFGRESRLEAHWNERLTKADFQRRLRAVKPARVQSSFAAAVELTMLQIHAHRRPQARLLLFVLWSGSNGRNTAEELSHAVRPFSALLRTELFAVTVNPSAQLERLRSLAGDHWHVFIDAKAKQFVEQGERIDWKILNFPASRILLECVLPPSRDLLRNAEDGISVGDSHEPRDSVERVEHLQLAARALQRQASADCPNDPIDLAILLYTDPEKGTPEHFAQLKRAAMDALRQAPAEHFQKRIRLWIWASPKLVLANEQANLDDALFAIERLDWPWDEERSREEFGQILTKSMTEWARNGREAARRVLLIFTHGIGPAKRLKSEEAEALHEALLNRPISSFILHFGAENVEIEEEALNRLISLNGLTSTPRFFNANAQGQMARFVDEFRRRVVWCRDAKRAADSAIPTERKREDGRLFIEEAGNEKLAVKRKGQQRHSGSSGKEKTENAENATLPSPTLPPLILTSSKPELPEKTCKVDLLLVLDTSQSVAEEFQQQLQFALELVKRLPDEDFTERIQVGVVSFHRTARLQFAMGELREKQAVLDALAAIQHTGGSTSVVSGINLAVEEAAKRRRQDARLMLVLVSDGNSQDPWSEVVAAAARLRAAKADVYAVTVSHDYFFRELELYAGNKWLVYIDARIRQFLDEAEMSLVECRSPSVPAESLNSTSLAVPKETEQLPRVDASSTAQPILTNSTLSGEKDCRNDPVDLIFILDTSTSVERDFYAQKIFALDLIRVLPERDFTARRLSIALVKFNSNASLQFPFLAGRRRDDVLYEIERIEYTGGQTSLVAGVETALAEIELHHRPEARLVAVIVSDGNSQDEWARVQQTAQRLRNATGGELFAVTLSEKFALEELLEYTKDETHIYTGGQGEQGVERFLQDVGHSVAGCPERELLMTTVPSVEASPTPSSLLLGNSNLSTEARAALRGSRVRSEFALDQGPLELPQEDEADRCKGGKMDLIIILDASTSRESVFEHQRELALSLIERLPINRQDTHVAIGINSFTNVPVLRQTLGLGRERKMVRKAIEEIKYRGGSTLTSRAVELAVQDLERGRRPDALQVVVLMNDGMSQDPWERVLAASKKLEATGAQRFGVALGEEVDLRELKHYVGDEQRIYCDGSTERFLQDVVALLTGKDKKCEESEQFSVGFKAADPPTREGFDFQVDEDNTSCQRPKLDLVVLLDNTDASQKGNDPKLNANRYLLLDVLGSLPLGHRIQIAVLSIGGLKLEYQFTDSQQPEAIFRHIEQIKPVKEKPSYAKAIELALDYFTTNRRKDAKGLLLLVGDGNNAADSPEELANTSGKLKQAHDLSCHAVDSSKTVNSQLLTTLTGASNRIYPYDRNAEFAHFLLDQAMAPSECQPVERPGNREKPLSGRQRQRDIAGLGRGGENEAEKLFGGSGQEKLLARVDGKEANVQKVLARIRAEYRPGKEEGQNEQENDVKKEEARKKNSQPEENQENQLKHENGQQQSQIVQKKEDEAERAQNKQKLSRKQQNDEEQGNQKQKSTPQPKQSTPQLRQSVSQQNGQKQGEQQQKSSPQRISEQNEPQRNVPQQNGQEQNGVSSKKPKPRRPTQLSTVASTTAATSTRRQRIQQQKVETSTIPQPPKRASTPKPAFLSPNPQLQAVPERPGCLVDLLLLIDSSGSVQQAFEREKLLAAEIVQKLRIGPANARVALIKFAAAGKTRTVHSFGAPQSQEGLLQELEAIPFSDGITAIDKALELAISEYAPLRGARPGLAQPLALVFTDGFGQADFAEQAALLHRLMPNSVYAIAIDNHERMPIAREELVRISGDEKRVFTDQNVDELHRQLRAYFRGC